MKEQLYQFINDNEPVEQPTVKEKFGTEALSELRQLIQKNRVSYNIKFQLQTDE